MKISRKTSVDLWTERIRDALDECAAKVDQPQYIRKLNRQHHSIRSWDLGVNGLGGNASAGTNGWRLLK